jgi:Asp-tRNA(Asn)/Glu-tRNA(Gln) amidotransferase A subunit family amidase
VVSGQSSSIPMLSATELVEEYRKRRLSPIEVTEAVLAQVDALGGLVNAYCLDRHTRARHFIADLPGDRSPIPDGQPRSDRDAADPVLRALTQA